MMEMVHNGIRPIFYLIIFIFLLNNIFNVIFSIIIEYKLSFGFLSGNGVINIVKFIILLLF